MSMSADTKSQLASERQFGWSGILFDLCTKQTKKAYKYAVRQVKQRQLHIASEKLGTALCNANISSFWKQVKAMIKYSPPSASPACMWLMVVPTTAISPRIFELNLLVF